MGRTGAGQRAGGGAVEGEGEGRTDEGGTYLPLPLVGDLEGVVGREGVDALVDVAFRLGVSHQDDSERAPAANVQAAAELEAVHHPADPEVNPAALQWGGPPVGGCVAFGWVGFGRVGLD